MGKNREQAYRDAIISLRVSINEAVESIAMIEDVRAQFASSILTAAVEYTDPDQIIKDCGCG